MICAYEPNTCFAICVQVSDLGALNNDTCLIYSSANGTKIIDSIRNRHTAIICVDYASTKHLHHQAYLWQTDIIEGVAVAVPSFFERRLKRGPEGRRILIDPYVRSGDYVSRARVPEYPVMWCGIVWTSTTPLGL